MSFVVSFAHVLRLCRKQCQPKRSPAAISSKAIAAAFTKSAFMLCPHIGSLPLSADEAKMKSSFVLYGVSCRHCCKVAARASHIGTGALLAFVFVRPTITPRRKTCWMRILFSSHFMWAHRSPRHSE